MPFIFSEPDRYDRPAVLRGAWQHGIALLEGAPSGPRFKHLTRLSHPYPRFDIETVFFARLPASPCAGLCARKGLDRGRSLGRWSASCRCAVTGQHSCRKRNSQGARKGSTAIPAGCF